MKIVCESCSAKYSIADEKVAGRVFKMRCKKCGTAIVVKGDAQAAEDAGRASFDYGGEAVWHTLVDGEQQGPFAPAQLGSMIAAGTIGWDAYMWREGFEEWKPAQDVEELVQAIMNPGGTPGVDEKPTLAQGSPSSGKSAPAKSSGKRDAGADLFAQTEASPFGGGGDEDDVVASAPSARAASSQAMTGARNENSVLFSLSNLQSLATTSPSSGASSSSSASKAPGPVGGKPSAALGDGSGLIDIRALASATGLTGGGGFGGGSAIGSSPAPRVDDLLSIGAPSVGLGSALAAPVIIAEKSEPARGGGMIAAAAIVAVALLGGAGIFAYVSLNHPPDPASVPASAAIVAPTPPPSTAVAAAPPPTTVAAPATTLEARATTVAAAAVGAAGRHPRPAGVVVRPTTSETGIAAAPPPHASGAPSIDELIVQATHPRSATTATPATPDSSLPTTPASGDVRSAMTAVTPAVTACGAGEHGVAAVAIVIAGPTGRVSSATVSGQFAGTPVGSCVARAVRGATFPHFRQATFSIAYPFRL